ncbi:MAG: twitching motility protein PilT [Deltaproteobacteria bacterium RBG_19FT_COMBO_52_11]|jgi:PIN domain nuclease of toxin-antitoxin system|nr:MAG: twitching motility protein PilT [Deltaproteobacteria bacterium RBG_19FT_COMBO_52_11]
MKILLDTHAFLWWITDDQKLSSRAREVISDAENELFFSAASGWEISIKVQLGRLKLPEEPERFIPEQLRLNFIRSLPIQMRHALFVSTLPNHHRDPFDRMLVAQAQLEEMSILSADLQMSRYQVELIW